MVGSHVAWIFVALLFGVGVGWLTYKRGRARLLDALIWIIIGLVVAGPILISNLAAAATPLGTLLALFYFVGCPLGWTWRQGALVEHRCAETDAKGYVFRGTPAPSRWRSLGQQREASATRSATAGSGGMTDSSRAAAVAATAHAVPSDGKDPTPSVTAVTGANAGVTTAPASHVAAAVDETAPSPSGARPDGEQKAPTQASATLSNEPVAPVSTAPAPTSLATKLESADDTSNASAPSSASRPDTPASGSDTATTASRPSTPVAVRPATAPVSTVTPSNPTRDAALGQPIASGSTPGPLRGDEPAGVTSISSPDGNRTAQSGPVVSEPGQPAQTSLDLLPASTTGVTAGKIEPEAKSATSAKSDPPASAPVPDQHKHAGARPPGFVTAREDRPDDLQLIRGIGPQNEGRLHGLGIWHFDQIGAWTVEEVRWVGSYLAFPGRIDREKWVEQAREIAAGGIVPKASARRPVRPR